MPTRKKNALVPESPHGNCSSPSRGFSSFLAVSIFIPKREAIGILQLHALLGYSEIPSHTKFLRTRMEEMSKWKLIGTDAGKVVFADFMQMVMVDNHGNSRKSLKRAESRAAGARPISCPIAMQRFLAPYFSSIIGISRLTNCKTSKILTSQDILNSHQVH